MVNAILNVIGTFLYPLFSIVFTLIDLFQAIFKAFAGTGTVGIGGAWGTGGSVTAENRGGETDTGIVYYLLNEPVIRNAFYSILLLAIFLLVIFTAMAFIKNVYAAKPKTWQDILADTFKGLANFIFIPVCCLLGVWLGNILLNAIDGATNRGGTTSLSGQLFVCSAYNANKWRDGTYNNLDSSSEQIDFTWAYNHANGKNESWQNIASTYQNKTQEEIATIVDEFYATNKIDLNWYGSVMNCYTLSGINYVLMVGGGVFILYVLISVAYGMVKRLFMLLMLFIISPAMCALFPLDGGKAVGSWKGDFVKNVISAYGAVAGMNLFFSIAPIIQRIHISGAMDNLGILPLILTIAGLFVVKEFISMISGYIGAGNAYTDGASLRSSTRDRIKKTGAAATKVAGGVGGAFAKASGEAQAGGSFFKSLTKSAVTAPGGAFKNLTGIDPSAVKKNIKDKKEEGKKEVNQKAVDRSIESIRDRLANNSITQREALGLAKSLGVEKEIANMVAEQRMAEQVRLQRSDPDLMIKKYTGDSVLEDQKVQKDAADAYTSLAAAEARKNDIAAILAQAGATSAQTTMGLSNDAVRNILARGGYTQQEIKKVTGPHASDKKQAMEQINQAVDVFKDRVSEFNSALVAARDATIATTKMTDHAYARIVNNAKIDIGTRTDVKVDKDSITEAFQLAKDSGNTSTVSAINTLQNMVTNIDDGLASVTKAINDQKVAIIKNSNKQLQDRTHDKK